jgi:hypothetical protein
MRGEGNWGSHYWNRLPDGCEVDVTAEQFAVPMQFMNVNAVPRSYVLRYQSTLERYKHLRETVSSLS